MSDPLGGLSELPPEPAPEREERPVHRMPRMGTLVLLGVLAGFFLAEAAVSRNPAVDDGWTLFRLGALFAPALQDGDWWRIGSYAFLHIGWIHIFMNGAALWALMPQIEATYGPNVAIGMFSATALVAGGSSAAWAMWRGVPMLVAGASGGIFGLFGATIALFWRIRHRIPPGPRKRIMRGIVMNLMLNAIIAFSGYVDNAAHIGGLVSGVLFGLVAPLPSLPRRFWHRPVYWGLVASALALFALEGAAVAWAVKPKPRMLHGDGVTAQVPGMLVPVKSGVAIFPAVAAVEIRAIGEPFEPGDDPTVRIGQRSFSRAEQKAEGSNVTQLATGDEKGTLEAVLECASERCRGASGDRMLEQIAATLRRTP